MRHWRFLDFLDDSGESAFEAWRRGLSSGAQASIDQRLKFMRALPKELWPRSWVSSIKGYVGIFELRIYYNNVQYRPLCFYGPAPRQITLLIGAIEKKKIPRSDFENAAKRRALVIANQARVQEHKYDDN